MIKEYQHEDIDKNKFHDLVRENEPFVLKNYLNELELKGVTIDEFVRKLSDIEVTVRFGNPRKLFKTRLEDYYNRFIKDKSQNEPHYVGNNTMEKKYFEKIGFHKNDFIFKELPKGRFWLGAKGSITRLHKDRPKNLSLQLFGRKKWIIFDSKDKEYLCYRHNNNRLEWSRYDLRNKSSCPEASKAKQYTLMMDAGDFLYLPEQWSHEVENITDSLMINFWIGTAGKLDSGTAWRAWV